MTCSKLLSSYIAQQKEKVPDQTLAFRKKWMWQYFLPQCGNRELTELTQDDMLAICRQMSKSNMDIILIPAACTAVVSFYQFAGIPCERYALRHFREISAEIHPAVPACIALCGDSSYQETFTSVLKLYKTTARTSAVRLYQQGKHIFPLIGDLPLNQITPDHMSRIISRMNEFGLSQKSAYTVWAETKRIFTLALKAGLIRENPCASFHLPYTSPARCPYPATEEEHLQLLAAFRFLPLSDLFRFCYYTGSSFSKAQRIRVSDVDLKKKECRVEPDCFIPVPDVLLPTVEKLCLDAPSQESFLFPHAGNELKCQKDLHRNLIILHAALGIDRIRLSDITSAHPLKRFSIREKGEQP